MLRTFITLLLVLFALNGCIDSVGWGDGLRSGLVIGFESGRVYSFDALAGLAAPREVLVPRYHDSYVISPDGSRLYFVASDGSNGPHLLALDATTAQPVLRIPLSQVAARSRIGPVALFGNYALALAPRGDRLLINGERAGVPGLVAVDIVTLEPNGFTGPLEAAPSGVVGLPPQMHLPDGLILVAGVRSSTPRPVQGRVFLLDPTALAVVDSVTFTGPDDDPVGGLREVLPTRDGRHAYVASLDSIYRIVIGARNVDAAAPRPSAGHISLIGSDSLVVVTDPGDGRSFPGSGFLRFYAADLEVRDSLDLRSTLQGGVPPVTQYAASSLDGSLLYVTSGTGSVGPLYGPQEGRILVIDLPRRQLLKTIPLQDWGISRVFAR